MHHLQEHVREVFPAGLLANLVERTVIHQVASVEQSKPIANPLCFVQSVGRQQDSLAHFLQVRNEIEDGLTSNYVETACRFVGSCIKPRAKMTRCFCPVLSVEQR